MHHPRLLIGLLVLATVLVDLAVWSVELEETWPASANLGYHVLIVWPLALTQASLVAIWVGYGGKLMPWTALLLVVTILGWGFLHSMITPPASMPIITAVLLLQSAMIAAILGLARLPGVRLVHCSDISAAGESPTKRRRIQFSLGFMLSWLTVVAVGLGLFSYSIGFERIAAAYSGYLDDADPGAVSFGSAAIAMAALWMILGTKAPLLRLVTLCVVTYGVVAAWVGLKVDTTWKSATVALGQVLCLCVSLAVVRVAGFRLVWRRAGRGASAGSTFSTTKIDPESTSGQRPSGPFDPE